MKDITVILIKIILIIIVIIIGSYSIYVIIDKMIENNIAKDDFCKSNGYNKATDSKSRFNDIYVRIECDNDAIVDAKYYKDCIKRDKFGDCTKQKIRYK